MSISNFDSSDTSGSGELFTAGTKLQDVTRGIADMLLNNASSVFGEITGSGPSGYTGYSSSLTGPTGSNSFDYNNPPYTTLYFKSDPARIFRIYHLINGIGAAIKDAQGGKATIDDGWAPIYVDDSDYNNEENIANAFSNDGLTDFANLSNAILGWPTSTGGYYTGENAQDLQSDIKVYFWCESDWLYLQTRSEVSGNVMGDAFIYTVDEPNDSSWTRSEFSSIQAIHLDDDRDNDVNLDKRVIRPEVSGESRSERINGRWESELGHMMSYRDVQGREYFTRLAIKLESNDQTYSAWAGYVPGIRVVRDSGDVSLYGETTVDSTQYIVVSKNKSKAYLIPSKTN